MAGKFVVKIAKDGQHYFNLKAGNGQIILTSEMYTTKAACENGIASVKENAPNDDRYERKVNAGGKPCFNLKAGNGQVIGVSQAYSDDGGCENGIDSVKENAPSAEVVEETD